MFPNPTPRPGVAGPIKPVAPMKVGIPGAAPVPTAPTPAAPVSAKSTAPLASSATPIAPVAQVPSIGVAPAHAPVSPQDYLRQRADGERQRQMRQAHEAIMSMSLGRLGKYGALADDTVPFNNEKLGISGTERVPGNGLNHAMAAMQAHYAALAQADAHSHSAQAQAGGDLRHNPAYMAAQVQHLQAQSRALDPAAEAAQMKAVLADPQLRAAYEIKNGAAPGSIPAPVQTSIGVNGRPLPQIHAGNIGTALSQPQNSGLAAITDDPNASFLDKLKRFGQIPDFTDPNSATRQVFNAHMHQLYPSQKEWQDYRGSHPVIGPDHWQTPVPLGPFKEMIGGPMMNIAGHLTGQGGTGTGFKWRKSYDEGNEESDLLAKYGIQY